MRGWLLIAVLAGCQTKYDGPLEAVEHRCHNLPDAECGSGPCAEYGVRWRGDTEPYAAISATVYDPTNHAAWAGKMSSVDTEWLYTVGPPCGIGVVAVAGLTTDTVMP